MAKTKENENLQEEKQELEQPQEEKQELEQPQEEQQELEQPQEEQQETAQKEKTVKLRLPLTKELQNDVFVRVNHRTWLIKRGETVEVPECVAEVLEHAEQATYAGLQFQAAHMQKVD